MSFAHPLRLLLLLGVAGLAAAYVVAHLRRRRAIARYTNPALHHLVAPDQLGWRRHLPPVLGLAALALVLVGVAQPTRPEKVARDQGVIVLAVDVSASMEATDIAPSRLEAAIAGAEEFVKDIPAGIDVGLVAFDGSARLLVDPTADHAAVIAAAESMTPGPGTAAGEAVYTALDSINQTLGADAVAAANADGKVPATIVLLSDGTTTVGRSVESAAQSAADEGVAVSTIAYGTPTGTVTVEGQVVDVPADDAAMKQVADTTGGTFFQATSAGELSDVYATIKTDVGYTTEQRDVSRGVLGLGLVALLGAVGFAIAWAARPL